MKAITIILSLVLLLAVTGLVSSMAYYCGDGICSSDYPDYNESNARSDYYCPADCGSLTTRDWCIDEYGLRDSCPTCPTCGGSCPTCRADSVSGTELRNWCLSSGYSLGGGLSVAGSGSGTQNNIIYWIIFLIIGALIGYYYKKNKRRSR